MQGNELTNGTKRHNDGTGSGLKALLIGGLLAATLTLSAGLAVVGTAAAATGVVVGGLGVAYGACQRVETDLANDLGMSVAALRGTDPDDVPARLAARGGAFTATQAQRAADRASAYSECRAVFAEVDKAWDER